MKHPYEALSDEHFWRRAVSSRAWTAVDFMPKPRFTIGPDDKIATAGSCFARNIARYLKEAGRPFYEAEPAHPLMNAAMAAELGYGEFSARFGNIYTTRQLRELFDQAMGRRPMVEDFAEEEGKVYDLMRPSVHGIGFSCVAEARADRAYHLGRCKAMFETADVLVFTLGLTEAWLHADAGYTYPVCPGTARGQYDPTVHRFVNFGFVDVHADLVAFLDGLRSVNPTVRVILTVSPVQLMASYTPGNVLVASSYSKSVLRAVCGEIAQGHDFVDYFPSYEIVGAPASGGVYLDADKRSVTEEGVAHVMACFFASYLAGGVAKPAQENAGADPAEYTRMQQAAATLLEQQCDELYNDPVVRRS